jgi:hypothetical protein
MVHDSRFTVHGSQFATRSWPSRLRGGAAAAFAGSFFKPLLPKREPRKKSGKMCAQTGASAAFRLEGGPARA